MFAEKYDAAGMEASAHRGGGVGGAFAGFLPWIIFWVVASPSTWKWAALAALIAAVVVAIPSAEGAGGVKILDLGTIAFFAVITVLAIFVDRSDLDWLEKYAQVISSGALALIALGSLAFTPFTEQYARDGTPRELWNTTGFKVINRQLTLMWGVVFALTAVSGLIAVQSDSGKDFFNWILPLILIFGAFKLQTWWIAQSQVRRRPARRPG
jgi:hypothetical protein